MKGLSTNEYTHYSRKRVTWPAIIDFNKQRLPVKIVNISEHGALIELDIKLVINQKLMFICKAFHHGKQMNLKCSAHVNYVIISRYGYHIGINFDAVKKEEKKFLADYTHE
ncbi:PilZ domain-containing protein [Zooshikella harenae]|uniref:PilZ domain-containing protein n=1 Tax=Zooshikella harenae TaxID=2827238 RepID=A0ABS5ZES7_9GAMM|nr:PilZ domain-containing protein [Zooshikella harenae]MBU2712569.1 PilZ domain-containing protein [Zooshikella harenae]